MFSATIFDYNGVLIDDEAVHLEAFRDVLVPYGISLSDRDYWERYLGFDDAGAFRAIFSDIGRPATEERVKALVDAKRPRYMERAQGKLRPFPGAAELVRRRAAAGSVAIVSGALRDEIALGLKLLDVADCVTAIVSAEDTTHSKPHPEGYLLAMVALEATGGAEPHRAVVIEDSIAGVEAAKTAKLPCVAVTHSYAREELERAGADLVVDRLDDVTDDALAMLDQRSARA